MGFQLFIFLLNCVRVSKFLISSKISSDVLGPLKESASVPLFTVCTLCVTKGLLLRRSLDISLCGTN